MGVRESEGERERWRGERGAFSTAACVDSVNLEGQVSSSRFDSEMITLSGAILFGSADSHQKTVFPDPKLHRTCPEA